MEKKTSQGIEPITGRIMGSEEPRKNYKSYNEESNKN